MTGKKICCAVAVLLALGIFLPGQRGAFPYENWIFSGGKYWDDESVFPHWEDFEILGVPGSPAVDEYGTVYAGSMNGFFFAINANGTQKWATRLGGCIGYTPALGNYDLVYVSNGNRLYALDMHSGHKVAHAEAACLFLGAPAVAKDGTVYVGSNTDRLFAFSPALGEPLWEFQAPPSPGGGFFANPVIGNDGTIYCLHDLYPGGGMTKLFAIHSGGTQKAVSENLGWSPNLFSPAIAPDGTLYVAASAFIYALDPGDLHLKWKSWQAHYLPPTGAPVIGKTVNLADGDQSNLIYAPLK